MNIRRWTLESLSRIRSDGLQDGGRESLRVVYHKGLNGVSALHDSGEPIYNRDWDLLVILDACRLDLMEEVAGKYHFLDDLERFRSLDSMTRNWMRKNFIAEFREEMSNTAYVCGNPFSDEILDESDFHLLDEVWKYVWEEPGTVPPRAISDRTIRASRETEADRIIAHYMQPHCPFLDEPHLTRGKELNQFGDQDWRDVWQKLRDNDLTEDVVREGYRKNLLRGLDEVDLLLENVDADRTVVTSDHGNAIGEWGIYGHPPGMPLDCLRVVPWINTTAVDKGTYDPELVFNSPESVNRDERLTALGYT